MLRLSNAAVKRLVKQLYQQTSLGKMMQHLLKCRLKVERKRNKQWCYHHRDFGQCGQPIYLRIYFIYLFVYWYILFLHLRHDLNGSASLNISKSVKGLPHKGFLLCLVLLPHRLVTRIWVWPHPPHLEILNS